MPTQVKSIPGLKNTYSKCSGEVQKFFEHLPALLDAFPMDVSLAYVFSRLELGQNLALYCGAVRVHKANAEVAGSAISKSHMTRNSFLALYESVFDTPVPSGALSDLKPAEKTRDLVMHGKRPSDDRVRNAIARVLEYAEEINKQLGQKCGVKPFGGKLRGFTGRSKKLDKRTTRFMLKGMGFPIP